MHAIAVVETDDKKLKSLLHGDWYARWRLVIAFMYKKEQFSYP